MITRHFDAVVLGLRPGALAAAAWLARRGFRILLLGDGDLPATYRYDGLPLRRRVTSLLPTDTPVFRRLVEELAQAQTFRRWATPLSPALHVFGPEGRAQIDADVEQLGTELLRDRGIPRTTTSSFVQSLLPHDEVLDGVLAEDAMWPPGTFWERRKTNRLCARIPTDYEPIPQELRSIVDAMARVVSHFAVEGFHELPPHLVRRLCARWLRSPQEIPGDEDALVGWFLERIRAAGGDVRTDESCAALQVQGGRVASMVLDGEGETISCSFVLASRRHGRLLSLLRGSARLQADAPLHIARRRFVVSVIVRRPLVPAPLSRHVVFGEPQGGIELVHLHRATHATPDPALEALNAETWSVEALVEPDRAGPGLRDVLLRLLRRTFPFFDRHLLVVDSPHDGGPLVDLRGPKPRLVAREELRRGGARPEPEAAEVQFSFLPEAYGGFALEPVRTSVPQLLCVGPSVLPGLGNEGELLAAWSAARIVAQSDRRRDRLRRETWSK